MTALRRFFKTLLLTASLTPACGGSSSETPPPLPPMPLNEPYRTKGAVEPREPLKPGVEADAEPEPEVTRNPPRGAKSKGPATWGSNAPEPLPELSPK
jgi:hypothetical protein